MKKVVILAAMAGLIAWFVGGHFFAPKLEPQVGPRIIIDEMPDQSKTPKRGRY